MASWQWLEWMDEPEAVVTLERRFFSGPTAECPVRIYRASHAGTLPVIVYLHGSGFTFNSIAVADAPHRGLAHRTGCGFCRRRSSCSTTSNETFVPCSSSR